MPGKDDSADTVNVKEGWAGSSQSKAQATTGTLVGALVGGSPGVGAAGALHGQPARSPAEVHGQPARSPAEVRRLVIVVTGPFGRLVLASFGCCLLSLEQP